ncbi:unnamed protein product, partial [Ixodes persulcatus]
MTRPRYSCRASAMRTRSLLTYVRGHQEKSMILDILSFHLYIHSYLNFAWGGYHILGDGAYQVREHLMTPYRDYGNLSGRQTSFNAKLCGTRVCIENTFGILKQRFRQLKSLELWTVEKMANVVMSCCVLHNLCM